MTEHKLINPHDPAVHCIQSRLGTSLEKIEEYAAMMQAGVQFDPCAGFVDNNGDIWLYDGKHRRESAAIAGSMLLCTLQPGTQQDAEWHAAHANTRHGLPRTRNDIINAVQMALRHPYGQQKSDRELALWCGCDHKTIGKYRKELEASGEIPQMTTRVITRGDQEYQMEIPVKVEPAEPPILNQPKEEPKISTKPTPTQKTLIGVIKAFMSLRFEPFTQAYEELGDMYRFWQLKEPYVSLVNELKAHLESLYAIDNFHFTVRDACQKALNEWTALYQSGYRGVLEPNAPASDANVCPECLASDGEHEIFCSKFAEEDEERREAKKEEHAFEARLERCQLCLGRYFLVKIDGVFGVTKIFEINEYLAKVRGVTYPYDPDVPFKNMACGTLNFELEDLQKELTQAIWERSKWVIQHKNLNNAEPEPQPAPEPIKLSEQPSGAWCSFCQGDYSKEDLYWSDFDVAICRKCASKAQIVLLHSNDPEVIAECQQMEHEIMSGFDPRRTGDLDKILQTGVLRIFRVDEYAKVLKQYTLANSTIADGIERITWGSWKIVEKFDTKKALKAKVLELVKESDCIFDGKSL